jgi:hypothetical protein
MAYLLRHPHLMTKGYSRENLRRQFPMRLIVIVNTGYLIAVLLAGVAPLASYVLLTVILMAIIARIFKFDLGS